MKAVPPVPAKKKKQFTLLIVQVFIDISVHIFLSVSTSQNPGQSPCSVPLVACGLSMNLGGGGPWGKSQWLTGVPYLGHYVREEKKKLNPVLYTWLPALGKHSLDYSHKNNHTLLLLSPSPLQSSTAEQTDENQEPKKKRQRKK